MRLQRNELLDEVENNVHAISSMCSSGKFDVDAVQYNDDDYDVSPYQTADFVT